MIGEALADLATEGRTALPVDFPRAPGGTHESLAQERRIKRKILGAPQAALIRFPRGFGDICRAETEAALAALRLKAALTPVVTLTANAVEVRGAGFVDLLGLTLRLATAREILWPVHEAKVGSTKALAKALAEAEWDLLLGAGHRRSACGSSRPPAACSTKERSAAPSPKRSRRSASAPAAPRTPSTCSTCASCTTA